MLTQEIFDSLPEVVQANYEKTGDEYVTKDSLKVSALKGSLDKAYGERDSLRGQMTEAEQKKADEIAQARDEAIKSAAQNGNWEHQEKLLREKFEDELKRTVEQARGEVAKEFTTKQTKEAMSNEIKQFAAAQGKNQGAAKAIEIIMAQHIKVNENGEREYFGEDGGALSITDFNSFASEFASFNTTSELMKGEVPSSGGGLSSGSLGTGGVGLSRSQMNSEQKAEYITKHGQESYLKLRK